VRSLHIMGRADKAVPLSQSLLLAERFPKPIIIEHMKGHLVPTKACILDYYTQFIVSSCSSAVDDFRVFDDPDFVFRCERDIANCSAVSDTRQMLCTSDACAISQREEIEALEAIFPENIHDISSPPMVAGDPTASFRISIPLQNRLDNEQSVQFQRLCTELSIKFIGMINF